MTEAGAPRITAALGLDTEEADRALREWGAKSKFSLTDANQGLELLSKGWSVVSGFVGTAVEKLTAWTMASAEAEKTQRLLGAAVGDHYDKLAAFNQATAQKLGMDDDDLAKMQTKLVGLGVQAQKLEEATKATLGLAASGKDAGRATMEVAKAFIEGGAEAKRLTELYALAEVEAGTFEGRARALQTAWSELDEAFGSSVTNSDAVKEGIGGITKALQQLAKEASDESFVHPLDELADRVARGWNKATAWVARGIAEQAGMVGGFINKIGTALKAVSKGDYSALGFENAGDQMPGMSLARVLTAYADGADPQGIFTEPLPPDAPLKGKPPTKTPRSVGTSPMVTPEQVMGGQNRYTEYDLESEKKAMDAAAKALDYQAGIAKLVDERREEQRRKREEYDALEEEATQQHYARLATIGWSGVTGFVSGTIQAWTSGRASMGEAALSAFGGMLAQLGQGLFAMGAGAVAAGILGTVAPIFAPATGGQLGVAAGLGLMAAGGTLMAFGGLASAAASSSKSTPSSAPTGGGRAVTGSVSGYVPSASSRSNGPTQIVIPVSVGRGSVVTAGDLGREIYDALREHDSRLPPSRRLLK